MQRIKDAAKAHKGRSALAGLAALLFAGAVVAATGSNHPAQHAATRTAVGSTTAGKALAPEGLNSSVAGDTGAGSSAAGTGSMAAQSVAAPPSPASGQAVPSL